MSFINKNIIKISHKTIINCFARQSRKSASWIIASHYANILFVLLSQNCHSFAPCYFGLGSLALTRRPTQNPLLTRSRLTGTPPFSADSSSPCERLRPQLARASWIIRVRIAFASSLLIFVTLKLALKQGYLLRRVSFTLFTSLPLTKQLLIVLLGRVENPIKSLPNGRLNFE